MRYASLLLVGLLTLAGGGGVVLMLVLGIHNNHPYATFATMCAFFLISAVTLVRIISSCRRQDTDP